MNRNTVEMAYYSELMGLLEKDAIAEKYAPTLSEDIASHISKHDPEYKKAAKEALNGNHPELLALGALMLYQSLSENPKMLKESFRRNALVEYMGYGHVLEKKFPDFLHEVSEKAYPFTLVDFEGLMKDVDKKEGTYDA